MKCPGALPAPPVESATALGRGWSRGQGQLQAAVRDGKDEVDDAEERGGIGGGYPIFTEAGGSDTRPPWELVYLAPWEKNRVVCYHANALHAAGSAPQSTSP